MCGQSPDAVEDGLVDSLRARDGVHHDFHLVVYNYKAKVYSKLAITSIPLKVLIYVHNAEIDVGLVS